MSEGHKAMPDEQSSNPLQLPDNVEKAFVELQKRHDDTCLHCNGAGHTLLYKGPCRRCNGSGMYPDWPITTIRAHIAAQADKIAALEAEALSKGELVTSLDNACAKLEAENKRLREALVDQTEAKKIKDAADLVQSFISQLCEQAEAAQGGEE